MYRVLTCLATEHDWRLVRAGRRYLLVRQRGRHQPVSSCQGLTLAERARSGSASTRPSAVAESGPPISSRCWLTIPAQAPVTIYPSRCYRCSSPWPLSPSGSALRCLARAGRSSRLGGAIIGSRRGGDALHRHARAGASGLHCLGTRHRFGLDRLRKRIRGPCNARRRAPRRYRSYRGRHRPADGRSRFTSFHGHGRRHAHPRSDARLRRADGFSGRAFVSDFCRRLCHSRDIAAGGHVRSPRQERTPYAEDPARFSHHQHVAGTLHVRCGGPHPPVQPALRRTHGPDRHAASGPPADRRPARIESGRRMGQRSRRVLQCGGGGRQGRQDRDQDDGSRRALAPRGRSAHEGRRMGCHVRRHHRMAGGPGTDLAHGAP